jgi:hypothetical protein
MKISTEDPNWVEPGSVSVPRTPLKDRSGTDRAGAIAESVNSGAQLPASQVASDVPLVLEAGEVCRDVDAVDMVVDFAPGSEEPSSVRPPHAVASNIAGITAIAPIPCTGAPMIRTVSDEPPRVDLAQD